MPRGYRVAVGVLSLRRSVGLRDNWGSHDAHLLSHFPHWDDGRNLVGLLITVSTLPGVQEVLSHAGEVNT